MKLPFIIIFDLDVIIGDTSFILNEYHLLNIIHMNCKIDNILNSCITKYDLTEELESGLLRSNFKDFIEFVKNKYKTVEFYIYSTHNSKWINSGIIDNIEKTANITVNKPLLLSISSIENILELITTQLILKYPSIKSQKNKDFIIQNQLLFFNSYKNETFSKLQIIPYSYNYYLYYNLYNKCITKYKINEDYFNNKEVLKFFEKKSYPIYNKNGSFYQQDLQLQIIIDLKHRRENELNNDGLKDTYFNDLMLILKRKRDLKIDDKTITKINEKLNKIE